jgi:hypothetical protein
MPALPTPGSITPGTRFNSEPINGLTPRPAPGHEMESRAAIFDAQLPSHPRALLKASQLSTLIQTSGTDPVSWV